MKNSKIDRQELSQISDFLIYFIMYIFTCYIGTVFVNFALHNDFRLIILGFKIQGAIILSLIFISIIILLINELNKHKRAVTELLIKIFWSGKKLEENQKELISGFENLLMAIILLPFLFTSWSYFYPLFQGYTLLVILLIFGVIYYLIFTFLKSLKGNIEKGIERFYNYLKKKKEELEKVEEE